MKKPAIWCFFAILILLTQPCVAAECPEFDQFFKEVDLAKKTWNDLYRLFTTYSSSGCDDGAYAEGYSDFVSRSLAKYWNLFPELASLTEHDSLFMDFVLKHIDATDDENDIKMLLKNARKRCQQGQAALCKEIEKAAISALKEIKHYK